MHCPTCDKHIPSNTKVCPHCGARIPDIDVPEELSPEELDAPIKWTISDTYAIVGFGLGFITGGLASIVAIIFSILSLKNKQKHRWISYWGLGANSFFIVAWITILIVILTLNAK